MKNFKLMIMIAMIVPVVMYGDDTATTAFTFHNKYTNDIYIQLPFHLKEAPHTEQIVDKTVAKDKTETYRVPSAKFELSHFVVTPSNCMIGGGASMKQEYKIKNGDDDFILTEGKKFKSTKQKEIKVIASNSVTAKAAAASTVATDSSTTSN